MNLGALQREVNKPEPRVIFKQSIGLANEQRVRDHAFGVILNAGHAIPRDLVWLAEMRLLIVCRKRRRS